MKLVKFNLLKTRNKFYCLANKGSQFTECGKGYHTGKRHPSRNGFGTL